MPEKIYFYILIILCEILSQGINGTFADEDIRESSDFLLRQKRVINRMPGKDKSMSIQGVPYTVIIRHNRRIKCVGSILSHHVVITIPQCVQFEIWEYEIISGTTRSDLAVNSHRITNVQRKFSVPRASRPADGIALLTINPTFVYGRNISYIPLHSEPLLPGTLGIVSGWGYIPGCTNTRGTSKPFSLRAIQVPIIAHRDCVNRYRPHNIQITDADVCTYHPLQHCGHTDGGAPLVIEGNLVGIHLFTGPYNNENNPQYPEVFALLQDSTYYQWIIANMRDIEAQFQNHHK